MELQIQKDYPLNGVLTGFEPYIFITTKKFIAQHEKFDKLYINVCSGENKDTYLLGDLQSRKDALHNFNVYMINAVGHFPKVSDVSCFMMYLRAENKEEDIDECYGSVYDTISLLAELFCKERNCVLAMVPHFHQGREMPHIHFLYSRKGKGNQFQEFIDKELYDKENG